MFAEERPAAEGAAGGCVTEPHSEHASAFCYEFHDTSKRDYHDEAEGGDPLHT